MGFDSRVWASKCPILRSGFSGGGLLLKRDACMILRHSGDAMTCLAAIAHTHTHTHTHTDIYIYMSASRHPSTRLQADVHICSMSRQFSFYVAVRRCRHIYLQQSCLSWAVFSSRFCLVF